MLKKILATSFVFLFIFSSAWAEDEPMLPSGLFEEEAGFQKIDDIPEASFPNSFEEQSPKSLETDTLIDNPSLPIEDKSPPPFPKTLEVDTKIKKKSNRDIPIFWEDESQSPNVSDSDWRSNWGITGFWEARGGIRTQKDSYQKQASIGETRVQTEWEGIFKSVNFRIKPDFIYDPVFDNHSINLETGKGFIDLREANFSFSPIDFMDIKIGRQILTWGTGDMLFINDMFPKDWQSFFIGRDDQYLKAPSDAFKMSLFSPVANLDMIYTPRFDADRFPSGERLSYYNAMLGRRAGEMNVIETQQPDDWFSDDEFAARLYKNFRGTELALYAYQGFWKSPGGMDAWAQKVTFPQLHVYGASMRGQIASGIANAEFGYYDSRDDSNGDNPFVDNGQYRFLLGYDRDLPEIVSDFKIGMQYYIEYMNDYEAYEKNLPAGSPAADETRHVLTLRLSKQYLNQNLSLSLFGYYSPTDADAYLRPNLQYKIDDHWTSIVGGNFFVGNEDHTFFGQFEKNSNAFIGLRYGF